MVYNIILKNLKTQQELVIDTVDTFAGARERRKNWRKVLGNKNWTVDRRPGLDTLDYLGLKIVCVTGETS